MYSAVIANTPQKKKYVMSSHDGIEKSFNC